MHRSREIDKLQNFSVSRTRAENLKILKANKFVKLVKLCVRISQKKNEFCQVFKNTVLTFHGFPES